MIQLGDYVIYIHSLKGFQLVRLVEIFENRQFITIELLDGSGHLSVSGSSVRPLYIHNYNRDNILKMFGFSRIENKGRYKYSLGNLIISSCTIVCEETSELIFTSLCVTDFSEIQIDIRRYIKDNKVDMSRFYQDYQPIQTINDLINVVIEYNFNLDFERILIDNINLF
ncbi:hypothetical protein [Flectobacillus longus]|uniref:hypothetical protein n=1 Tax=Flectobacillus longus TaxID=2984207 RepID=UPI0024B7A162|nr:hypothetical protein [Flectobacillus longus]MDI9880768.1 hypothetical protein [Flectobacillus longus]